MYVCVYILHIKCILYGYVLCIHYLYTLCIYIDIHIIKYVMKCITPEYYIMTFKLLHYLFKHISVIQRNST